MLILGINKICEWCQITTNSRHYTCPIKINNGELFFKFKKVWHPVSQFLSENCQELVEEGGNVVIRTFIK